MGTFVMIGQVILGLSILIILHELGHFLAARAFGIKVEKFYLFFDAWGVKLFKFTYKDCEYGIGWLPLGGYVKIAGMIDESMDTEQLKQEPQPWEFRSKPAWQRLIVMLGGIIVNVIVGILVFWMLTFRYGETDIDNMKLQHGVVPGIIGKDVGIQVGDKILAINGRPAHNFYADVLSSEVLMGDAVLTIERNNATQELRLPADILNAVAEHKKNEFVRPREKLASIQTVTKGSTAERMKLAVGDSIVAVNGRPTIFLDQFTNELKNSVSKTASITVIRNGQSMDFSGTIDSTATIGISLAVVDLPITTKHFGFWEALPIGTTKAVSVVTDNIRGFGKIFKGDVRADKALSGPVGIAKMFGTEVNWVKFWSLVGMLSMALAFMNLLPIPALDGGHVIFLLVEMIQGKPLSDNFLEKAQMVGFFILIALMLFTLGNDIIKW
ncbi:site-2 protease [Sphingobacterium allocomposti]|uniref:Zinc metalloprotease n=1 Tax=Sphingobacterium allocomposti TaxID=415956 RepID=A0A5S5DB84_9SPHI|nr:RIP metalloprotease RseP [Sphingobacterium composti Yoo et al. 2007 non Ten et al. 2007]TYP93131.1 site-2 protease [Sphingobacterium composti Yoo et al. 2007 non Ten et al. 2007]